MGRTCTLPCAGRALGSNKDRTCTLVCAGCALDCAVSPAARKRPIGRISPLNRSAAAAAAAASVNLNAAAAAPVAKSGRFASPSVAEPVSGRLLPKIGLVLPSSAKYCLASLHPIL